MRGRETQSDEEGKGQSEQRQTHDGMAMPCVSELFVTNDITTSNIIHNDSNKGHSDRRGRREGDRE